MNSLDLYASIEKYLDFTDEIYHLYKTIGHIILSKEIKTVIDIGCGQGEFCNLLNINGIKSFGVDLSCKQIEYALAKNIDAKCIDIKDIKNRYDCATATFDVLNYIPKDNLKEFITHSYNLLNSGGYFIFDINTLYGFQEIAQGTLTIDLKDENKFIAIDANFEDDILYTDITLFEPSDKLYKRYSGTIEQFYHLKEDLTKIVLSTGFIIEDVIEFNLHSDNQSDKQIFICKKG